MSTLPLALDSYLVDWLDLLLRWLHVIAAIAWIGASFYFIWLDNHLHAPLDPADAAKGIGGEVWAVHGGGFYTAKKFTVAPATLPPELRAMYRIRVGAPKRLAMGATFAGTRALRPLLPPRYRYIAPYQEWRLRRRGKQVSGGIDRVRRSAGVRLDRAKSIRD